MLVVTRFVGALTIIALSTMAIGCGGATTVTVTVPASTAASATATSGPLPETAKQAGKEFARNMDVLSAVCLNGSQIGDASTDDLNPAATTLIRLARRYPTATWNGPLGKRPLPDALTDVAEKIAPCYPDLGKRLTSAGKQIKP